jgi:acylphosphatase
MNDRKSIRVRIEGCVQRVWYRAWTLERARARGLQGWVKNRLDGTVEAVFAGSSDEVDVMVAECWQGSAKSEVINVTVEPADDPGDSQFEQRPTD